jgi:hypothetical protein
MNPDQTPQAPLSAMAIGMVKNEADIVEAFVRHNLHFVDLMVLLDNGSTDGTREILTALQQEGLPLLVIDDPVFGYFQSEKMTELYRRVVPVYQPELVYLLDADEFLRAPGRAALDGALRQLPAGCQALLPWMTFTPDPGISSSALREEPLASSPWRRRTEGPQYHKAVVRRCPTMDDDLVIDQGNHTVHRRSGKAMQAFMLSGVHLAHLPVRTVEQVTAKAVNGWLAYLVRNRHTQGVMQGSQWQVLFDRVTRGEALVPEDVVTLSLDYAQHACPGRSLETHAVHDPCVARHGALRYLGLGQHDPLAKVALSVAEHLVADDVAGAQVGAPGAVPVDVAAVRCILQPLGLKSFVSQSAPWLQAMGQLWPECALAPRATAQALILPNVVAADVPGSLGPFHPQGSRRVVAWLPPGHMPSHVAEVLSAFAQFGWEPDVKGTLGLRAVASYGDMRRGGLLMCPKEEGSAARAAAMGEALQAMAAQPDLWVDPPAQSVAHFFQSVALGQTAPAARVQAVDTPQTHRPASVLFGASSPRLQRAGQAR